MNFGLWREDHSSFAFPAACADLARAVADAASMPRRSDEIAKDEVQQELVQDDSAPQLTSHPEGAGSTGVTVLDLGCGCGDQLQLWAREYRVQRISACTPELRQVIGSHCPAPSSPSSSSSSSASSSSSSFTTRTVAVPGSPAAHR